MYGGEPEQISTSTNSFSLATVILIILSVLVILIGMLPDMLVQIGMKI
jgi:hypothetical protein